MAFSHLFDEEQVRVRVVLAAMLAVFAVLLAALFRMQVAHGKRYQESLLEQSVRRVRLPGMRGRIFDRNGLCMADNRPSYGVAVYLEELRRPGRWSNTIARVEGDLDHLAEVLGLPRQASQEDLQTHIRKRLPLPLMAWKDVDDRAIARLEEHAGNFPGVEIVIEAVREYPQGGSACHVLGYVGRAEPPPGEEESFHYYLPEMGGKSGVEKVFDGVLRGEAGGRLVRVDVSGFRHDDLAVREARPGRDVILAIDLRAQRLVEEALADVRGAAVVVDPSTGDVLALASSPGFDPGEFAPSIGAEQWKALSTDEAHPLVNRAVAGAYAPGSTFKPVVALAAVENNAIKPSTTFRCPGYFLLGRARFDCWYKPGHGVLNLRESLEHSCNVYLFNAGLKAGPEAIYHMAVALGLGSRTDVALDFEVPGLVPDNAWKMNVHHDAWRDGDTCNLSIGQGALAVTPIQMAMLTAALANGGRLLKPRLVMGVREPGEGAVRTFPVHVVRSLEWSKEARETVRGGMRDVVMSERGTGRWAAVPGLTMAGKTGTAEYGKKEEGRKLAWMIAFAPFESPRYAMAMMIEDAESGGVNVAPRIRKVMGGLFRDDRPAEGSG